MANSPPQHRYSQIPQIKKPWSLPRDCRQRPRTKAPQGPIDGGGGISLWASLMLLAATTWAFAMVGVIIAQFFRLNHSLEPNPHLGFFLVGVPLSCVCHASAILISGLGALRFIRYQKAMARGDALSGGWEMTCIGVLTTLILVTTFLLTLIISVKNG
ncbi:uncharacterized protein A1O5_13157 [Cladophialophora psammophila CBS 110553]|uniref:DUF202 domain-containing protein n=1 Tax=Cladophialophora psammophila CBS 110553 TaxID=1182543 RepID=W9VKN9_9EURO|nr:uncharacterized protein A1O5_13157 [Cladophialophora psammophila CBS 110553]EXJ53590.1 hypothetical protein A1O5_13157 [Cladophialophora psammophila CBS 110553]